MSVQARIEPAFASLGKEVLRRDGTHYADACDPRAAEMIVAALNRQAEMIEDITEKLMAFEASDFA